MRQKNIRCAREGQKGNGRQRCAMHRCMQRTDFRWRDAVSDEFAPDVAYRP